MLKVNCGYLASLGHFQITATENGEKSKSGIFVTQRLSMTVLPYLPQIMCFWKCKSQELVNKILLCNKSFKISDGY